MSHYVTPPPLPPLDYAIPAAGGYRESPVIRFFAWIVIIVSVAALGWSNWHEAQLAPVVAASEPPGLQIEIVGRYVVGANSMLAQSGNSPQIMVAQLDNVAKSPIDKLAAITVLAELEGKQAAPSRLDQLKPSLSPDFIVQAKTLRTLYSDGSKKLSAGDRAALPDRLSWFGKLALTFGQPATDPDRAVVLADARRTMGVMFAGGGILLLAMLSGGILLVILLVFVIDKKFKRNYRPPVAGGGAYLEAFAIYIGGMTATLFSLPYLPGFVRGSIAAHVALMFGPTIIAIAWPAFRGAKQWRAALGWHAGAGAFREMGLGLLGYIAGLPLLAIGFFITAMLIKSSDSHPSHPIEHMLGVSPQLTLFVFFLASIYAPITEETMFRGAFFSALRARHGWILSAIVSSFIFAAIHPQGWTLIPMLMSIAIVLAGIREWRGTILSSAAAHCLHNTMLLIFAIMMMS